MSPTQLIRAREAVTPPETRGTRFYSFVRARAHGESTFEVWAARNATTKGAPLRTKCVMRIYSDSRRYLQRDLLFYSNWSCMAHNQWCVDFTEYAGMRGTNYMDMSYRHDEKGIWLTDWCTDAESLDGFQMPLAPLLNDFSGTNLRYCAWTPASGISFRKYLALYRRHPKAELLMKAQLYHLVTDEFLAFMETHPTLGRFLARNLDSVRTRSAFRVLRDFSKAEKNHAFADLLAARKRAKEEAARRRRRERQRAEAARIRQRLAEQKIYDAAIAALYARIRALCGRYAAYEVVIPQNAADMVYEGEAMHNCIGQIHTKEVASGSEVCIFLHKDGKPCVDIAISTTTYKVTECRAVCNAKAPADATQLAKRLAKALKPLMTKVA